MIGLGFVYAVAGAAFAGFAVAGAAARRWANALFHAALALSFLTGDRLGDVGNGILVLALVAIAASRRLRGGAPAPERPPAPARLLLALALVIPATALGGTLLFRSLPALVDARQATLVALTCGVLLALVLGLALLRALPQEAVAGGRRLADAIGWAMVLPQFLASLGAIFALAGVGGVVGGAARALVPTGSALGAVLAYGLGMAAFTMLLGNAFAAFPVMAAAIGVPLLIQTRHADPAAVAAIGMLTGFSGTLLTPMAANFNLVPAALLGLRDRYGVIRAQLPTALPLLAFNLALLWWVVR